jgi:uncharacterized phage protein gp47/JayE
MSQLEFDAQTGLNVPATQSIRDDLGAKMQACFQTKPTDPLLNIEPSSPAGQFLDLVVAEIEAKNTELVFLANMIDPDTAQGRFLDALASLYGIRRKISEPTIVTVTIRGLNGTLIPYGVLAQDTNGNQYRHAVANGQIIGSSGEITTTFASVEHGAIEVAAHSLNRIVTVVAGWDSIDNDNAGALGRDTETDAELRTRMRDSYAINGTGYTAALRANLANLDGVIDVAVLENKTNQPRTEYGITIDPHSIAVCIVGGSDTAIAEIIYRRKDCGCGTTGNQTIEYHDDEYDATYEYQITRPVAGDLKIKVETFATSMSEDAKDAIKTALIDDVLGRGVNPRVGIAQTLYASRFYQVVQAVSSAPVKLIHIALNNSGWVQGIDIPANVEPTLDKSNITILTE